VGLEVEWGEWVESGAMLNLLPPRLEFITVIKVNSLLAFLRILTIITPAFHLLVVITPTLLVIHDTTKFWVRTHSRVILVPTL